MPAAVTTLRARKTSGIVDGTSAPAAAGSWRARSPALPRSAPPPRGANSSARGPAGLVGVQVQPHRGGGRGDASSASASGGSVGCHQPRLAQLAAYAVGVEVADRHPLLVRRQVQPQRPDGQRVDARGPAGRPCCCRRSGRRSRRPPARSGMPFQCVISTPTPNGGRRQPCGQARDDVAARRRPRRTAPPGTAGRRSARRTARAAGSWCAGRAPSGRSPDISAWKTHSGSIVSAVWRCSRARSSRSRWTGLTACIADFSGRWT